MAPARSLPIEIAAKARDKGDTEGVGQAKAYAEKLQARFAFSTNGRRIYQIDMATGKEGYVERYPTPDELWAKVFETPNAWRNRFAAIPFETSGKWEARYYQHNAIENTLEAIAAGKQRILLTLATGTGKTAIAFQIAWALFQSRWNLSRQPEHRPRILFLADRNILADQAYNAFSAFGEDGARARIKPDEIRQQGRVPKNASVFFTIFQTFMSGTGPGGKPAAYYGDYPKDFFDFIIIDECHRGGANDESNWRDILDYFSPAVQLGMTATPRRADNVDTYKYFGEPSANVDFSQFNLRLAYILAATKPPTGDLYAMSGDDELRRDWAQLREGRKKLTSAMFNRSKPLTRWPGKTVEDRQALANCFPKGTTARAATSDIRTKHSAIADYFENARGLGFMRIESDILVATLLSLMKHGITALPIHDAVLVSERHAATAKATMESESKRRIGTAIPAELKLSSGH